MTENWRYAIYTVRSFPTIYFAVCLDNPRIFAWSYDLDEVRESIKKKIQQAEPLDGVTVPDYLPEIF